MDVARGGEYHAMLRFAQRKWPTWVLLAMIVGMAFWVRVAYQFDLVFQNGEACFQETDPWCHMRQVDALVHTFPRQNFFDVYGAYPGGAGVAVAPFFDWLLALIILIIGIGHPSQGLVDQVGAYFPAVLGALVPLASYHVARLLFNRAGGLTAAVLTALAPGQLLVRSLLGYTDHHAMESLLSTLILWCLVSFLLYAGPSRMIGRESSCDADGRHARRRACGRWLCRGVLAAVVLAMYLLSWTGGAILVGILAAWLCIQYVVEYMVGRDTTPLVCLGLPLFAIPLLAVYQYAGRIFGFPLQVYGLLLGLVAICLLHGLGWVIARRRLRRRWFLIATIVLSGLSVFAFRFAAPSAFGSIVGQFGLFSKSEATIQEALPLLHAGISGVWTEFGPALYLAIGGFAVLAIRVLRRGEAPAMLMLVCSVAMAAATLGQRRFSYYLGADIAILGGGFVGMLLTSLWQLALRQTEPAEREAAGRPSRRTRGGDRAGVRDISRARPADVLRRRIAIAAGLTLAVIVAIMWPTTTRAIRAAGPAMVPNADWREAMQWLRENTPEPFGDPKAYYAYYGSEEDCRAILEGDSAYGVLGWWDCGYWIMRMAHRIPISNPTQHAAGTTARFMTAQDEETATRIARECGAKYVVLDVELPAWQPTKSNILMGKFENMVRWTGKSPVEFYERYYRRDADGALLPIVLYYPAYYRTLITRLYVCRGKAYQPQEAYVVSYRDTVDSHGDPTKEVIALHKFASYAAAAAFVEANKSERLRIVGISPFYPCVPLERMEDYTLVHQSPTMQGRRSGEEVRYVEIYELAAGAGGSNGSQSP